MNRIHLLGAGSTILSFALVIRAFAAAKGHFFASCISITQHNVNFLVLLSMTFYYVIMLGKLIQFIWFGSLRALEVEHLYERSWFAIMDTCLALTMFRDGFDFLFILRFATLLFAKTFHWLIGDRIDFMEQTVETTWKFHARIISIMLIFFALDISMLVSAINFTLDTGPSMLIVFGFEYLLLSSMLVGLFFKYLLQTVEMRRDTPWEDKQLYFSYVDLAQDFVKLASYIALVAVLVHYYGIPIHIIRDVYMTLRSFIERLTKIIRSRQAVANMETRYGTATEAELAETDRVCIICREEMIVPNPTTERSELPKKLPCGHIFHFRCLRGWLDRQQACPTCRRSVLENIPEPAGAANANINPERPPIGRFRPEHEQQEQIRDINEMFEQLRRRDAGENDPIILPNNISGQAFPEDVLYPVILTPFDPQVVNLANIEVHDSLTDEELQELQGNAREDVIARLKALDRIRHQLLGVSTQLNQLLCAMPPHESQE